MLSSEENELICRTGPGTPMGELWRRFWLPIMLAKELPERDGPPVRARILSEDLIAFRDRSGAIGLVANNCPHRGASLFFGRNEEEGLRCVYHGWKFDRSGACIDMPNEPAESNFKSKVHVTAYAAQEAGGFVWAYMGPRSRQPELPRFGFNLVPENQRLSHKVLAYSNYLQALEGDLDPVHISFLHGTLAGPQDLPWRERLRLGRGIGGNLPDAAEDVTPTMLIKETQYGFSIGARRNSGPDHYMWRINQFLMPAYALIPGPLGLNQSCTIRIPIDDENSWAFRSRWNDNRPLTAEELVEYTRVGVSLAETHPGTFIPVEHRDNDYLIDRDKQRRTSMTGIKSISQQDRAVTETMGPIYDRTKEHLGTTDVGIIVLRRILTKAARDLQAGIEPRQAQDGGVYKARAPQLRALRSVSFDQLVEDYVLNTTRV